MIESIIIAVSAVLLLATGMAVQKYLIDTPHQSIPKSFIKNNNANSNISSGITLDETKVVLKIDTSNLEKRAEVVGETVVVNNDTSNAINKLKNMKGK